MPLDRPLTKEQVDKLESKMRKPDPEASRHNVREYRGTIESIEEERFPWLKRRRQRR